MKYFVYIHRKQSNGQIFYVGKGCRYRHKSKTNRSQHWHNIVNKHGYVPEIIQNDLNEKQAFELEKQLIALYKDQGLCNLTDGGDGASGFIPLDSTRALYKEMRSKKEYRDNLSKKAKERWLNPKLKENFRNKIKQAMNREEVKQKLQNARIKHFLKPEARELARKNTLKQFSNPLAVENARIKALQRYNTPEKRASHAQAKAVICIETGMIFGTCTLASEWLKATIGHGDNSQISKVCRGVIKSAYGYTWKYIKQTKEVLD